MSRLATRGYLHCQSIHQLFTPRCARFDNQAIKYLTRSIQFGQRRDARSKASPSNSSNSSRQKPSTRPLIKLSSSKPRTSVPPLKQPQYVAPVAPKEPKPEPVKSATEIANELLGDKDELMLYASPSHGSLLVNSGLGGGMYVSWCTNVASGLILTGQNMSWFLRAPTLLGCGLGLAMGWVMLMTCARQINRLRLIRDAETRKPKLSFDTKWRILFWQPRNMTIDLGDASADRNVRELAPESYSVDMEKAESWTKFERELQDEGPFNFSRILQKFFDGVNHPWETIKRDTGRIFVRLGMAYVRIGKQEYKMDLHHCYMLDNGVPFAQLVPITDMDRDGILKLIRRHLASS